jgi:hypothetical protein
LPRSTAASPKAVCWINGAYVILSAKRDLTHLLTVGNARERERDGRGGTAIDERIWAICIQAMYVLGLAMSR